MLLLEQFNLTAILENDDLKQFDGEDGHHDIEDIKIVDK